ncbi:hypothetical protein BCR33DRAFT_418703 [Rhizoclosmatium globosum]|uniref:Uncharacterized protein n=1 Tax=Rhizoclosmatium globosum TaxID=329046 RepID=A0A1Y2BWK4_9FUNG|nr:hypothetical protein BCR33DRAFT_418703 [Rhizoclosmatium globosum]|eukprot:ORY39139.1 hypothetical protein BCR33DRAFT_418703 [Rhizoclosmatium globosum]
MKAPSQVYDPYPIFSPIPTRPSECRTTELIVQIKKWRAVPPSSIFELATDLRTTEYSRKLAWIRASAPVEVVLDTKQLDVIDREEETLLVDKIITSGDDRVVAMNMAFETAQSTIHRPILFVSSLRSYHPLLLSKEHAK